MVREHERRQRGQRRSASDLHRLDRVKRFLDRIDGLPLDKVTAREQGDRDGSGRSGGRRRGLRCELDILSRAPCYSRKEQLVDNLHRPILSKLERRHHRGSRGGHGERDAESGCGRPARGGADGELDFPSSTRPARRHTPRACTSLETMPKDKIISSWIEYTRKFSLRRRWRLLEPVSSPRSTSVCHVSVGACRLSARQPGRARRRGNVMAPYLTALHRALAGAPRASVCEPERERGGLGGRKHGRAALTRLSSRPTSPGISSSSIVLFLRACGMGEGRM